MKREDKSDIKNSLYVLIAETFELYIALNRLTLPYLAKLFDNSSKLYSFFNSTLVALAVNAVAFVFIGWIFGGLINSIAIILMSLNIVAFLIYYITSDK